MPRERESPGDVCQVLCLSSDGYESVTCRKRGDYTDLTQRIQTRFDHIMAVQSIDNNKLRAVNTMYRWLFVGGEFDPKRFASALKQSRQCDWACCEGPVPDQNTTSGRRAAAHAWGVSEECLTTFFGHDVSGNTWREIGSFSKKAPVWELARPALLAAREKRLKEGIVNKRLSLKKTWSPYDPKTAIDLYKAGERDKHDLAGYAEDGLTAYDNMRVRATNSASCTTVSHERSSSLASAVHTTIEAATDAIVVSSRPLPHEQSPAQDRGAKRPRSEDAAAWHSVPRRRTDRASITSADGPRNVIDAESLETLRSGRGVPSDVIYAALRIVECAIGNKLMVVDPTTPQAFNRFLGDPGTHRLIPLCHQGHWVLGVLYANQDVLRIYDPQPSLANRRAIKEIVAISSAHSSAHSLPPEVRFTAPLLQDAEEDSGLLLIVSALYVSLDRQVPQDVDITFWREVFHVLLMPLSTQEAFTQTYVLEKPLVSGSSPEKVSMPGSSINVGELSTTLTPVEVLALLEKLRAETLTTYQRLKTTASSASSALEIVTALKECARARCQREVENIGDDVIGSLIRLNRVKETCEEVYEGAKGFQATLSKILGRLSTVDDSAP